MIQTVEQKRQAELILVRQMIGIYCRGRHKTPTGQLCPDCARLAQLAAARTARCPRMAEKTFCSACPHPCYPPQARQTMQDVMRYAGPRMLLHDPAAALRHLIQTKKL